MQCQGAEFLFQIIFYFDFFIYFIISFYTVSPNFQSNTNKNIQNVLYSSDILTNQVKIVWNSCKNGNMIDLLK